MPSGFEAFDALVRSRATTLVDELKELIRLPTVSAQPNENIKVTDHLDHIRAFGRFLHVFAGRSL